MILTPHPRISCVFETVGVHVIACCMFLIIDINWISVSRPKALEEFVECMANNGADVAVAKLSRTGLTCILSGLGVEGIKQHCDMLSDKYETSFLYGGLCNG